MLPSPGALTLTLLVVNLTIRTDRSIESQRQSRTSNHWNESRRESHGYRICPQGIQEFHQR